ncbi:MAG: hypothetical protein PHR77_13615 [Kiritimatiellae bacterium]|nr:hypothetical protein [Kiritimatiellia bacterium]MDD5520738.1 hypothetical protein [Kiritimatiellia bacterium]
MAYWDDKELNKNRPNFNRRNNDEVLVQHFPESDVEPQNIDVIDSVGVKPNFNRSTEEAIKLIDLSTGKKPMNPFAGEQQPPVIQPMQSGEFAALSSNPFTKEIVSPVVTNNPTLDQEFRARNFDVQNPAATPTIRPTFGKSGLDLNGDGIPDGATVERIVQHQGPNGEQVKDKIRWNKPTAPDFTQTPGKQNPFNQQTIDENRMILGATADKLIWDSMRPKTEAGADVLKQTRIKMGMDKAPDVGMLNPFTGLPTTAEEALSMRKSQLERQKLGSPKFGGMVSTRVEARGALAALEQQERDRKNREERMDVFGRKLEAPLNLQAMKGKQAGEELDKKIQADLDLADRRGGWAVKEREVQNVGLQATEQERSRSKAETTQLLKEGRYTEALVKGIFAKTVAEINADAKKVSSQLIEQGKERLAKILHENRFKMDGLMMVQLMPRTTEKQQIELVDQILKSIGVSTTPDASSGTVTTQGQTPGVQPPFTATPVVTPVTATPVVTPAVPAPVTTPIYPVQTPGTPAPVSAASVTSYEDIPVMSPEQAKSLPAGTKFRDSNGTLRVRNQPTPVELAPGTIHGNFSFKGGDPNQASNWLEIGEKPTTPGKPGQSVRNRRTGKIWTWTGTDWN